MSAPAKIETKPVNLRIRDDVRSVIDQAAALQGRTRSDFMIDAARRVAEDVILDQRLISLDAAGFNAVLDVIDKPANGPGFDKLMAARKPWES